jgi:hypothetical protein
VFEWSNNNIGSFPHNSKTEGFKYFQARLQITFPASSEPVKLTHLIFSLEIINSDLEEEIKILV